MLFLGSRYVSSGVYYQNIYSISSVGLRYEGRFTVSSTLTAQRLEPFPGLSNQLLIFASDTSNTPTRRYGFRYYMGTGSMMPVYQSTFLNSTLAYNDNYQFGNFYGNDSMLNSYDMFSPIGKGA